MEPSSEGPSNREPHEKQQPELESGPDLKTKLKTKDWYPTIDEALGYTAADMTLLLKNIKLESLKCLFRELLSQHYITRDRQSTELKNCLNDFKLCYF